MQTQFKQNIVQNLAVGLAAVVLFLSVWGAYNSGKLTAQSKMVVLNSQSLVKGLDFFFQDQDRLPTATEYGNLSIMKQYFNAFPPASFVDGRCSDSYNYKRVSTKTAELSFCLSKGVEGYSKAWNKLLIKK